MQPITKIIFLIYLLPYSLFGNFSFAKEFENNAKIYITSRQSHNNFNILPVSLKFITKSQSKKNLSIPRFASLKSNKINGRLGPSLDHPIIHKFISSQQPVLIVQKTNTGWYRVIDKHGYICWIKGSLLSQNQYISFFTKQKLISLYKSHDPNGQIYKQILPSTTAKLISCKNYFCKIRFTQGKRKYKGFIKKNLIWGLPGNMKDYINQLNQIDELTMFEYL